jgi:hypothetical protein
MPTTCAPHNAAHPGPLAWCLPKGVIIWCCPDAWNEYYKIEVAHELKEKMKQSRLKELAKVA